MRHVVHLIPAIHRIGGAERQMISLAEGLGRRGWRVSVIALSGQGGDALRQLEASQADFVSLGMRKGLADPRGWLRLNRWLHRNTPDVVHSHLPHATWMARLTRLLAPVRVVVDTVHTASTGSAARCAFYRATTRLTDCVSAVSRTVANTCVQARMTPQTQMVNLPNGVDLDAWNPDPVAGARLRAETGLANNFLWLAVGRLEPVKDYETLLQAFAGLPRQPHLVIAGSGSLEPRLQQLCRSLAIASRVRFLGSTPHVLPWMQAADAVVLASRWEGLPMCLLEAGACALPCIATNVAGSNEIVVDGETGFLAQPGHAESLRGAMLRLMQLAPANRRSIGSNARHRIERYYGLESVLDRWDELYSALLVQQPSPVRFGRPLKPIPSPR